MFEPKDEIKEFIEALYRIVEDMKRGQILTHETISKTLGLQRYEGRWLYIITRVRRKLEAERGIAIWPVTDVGYKLLTPAEQLELPTERMRRGLRQVRRGRKSVEALPDTSLSLHQRRAKVFLANQSRETERAMRRSIQDQAEQIRPTPTIPRRVQV